MNIKGFYYPYPIKNQQFCDENSIPYEKEIYQSNGDRIENLKAKIIAHVPDRNIQLNKTFPFKFNKMTNCLVKANNLSNLLLYSKGRYYFLNYY